MLFKYKPPLLQKVVPATTFESIVTFKTYLMFHQLTFKSSYNIGCLKYQTLCVGKSETEFNVRLSNYKNNITSRDSITVSNHFDIKRHDFKTCKVYTYRATWSRKSGQINSLKTIKN